MQQLRGQSNINRVYSSTDPRYKFNVDTAFVLLGNNNYGAAIPFLQAALNISDKSYSTYLKLANALNKTGQTDRCFETLRKMCDRHWVQLGPFIEQQEGVAGFMFANLLNDNRWASLKVCIKLKREAYQSDLKAATLLMHQNKYSEAIPHLKEVLQLEDKSHLIEIELARAYNKTGQTDLCFEVLNKIAADWEWMEDYLQGESAPGFSFSNLVTDKRWLMMKGKVDSLDLDQSSGHNRELMHTLRSIERTDQFYRNLVPYENQPQVTKNYKDSIWKLQTVIDSVNLLKVIEIMDKYGYPGDSLVGNTYSAAAWLVMQHAPLKYQEKYLPLIKAAADKKQLPMADLALLVDRIEMGNNRPQIYGSQINCDSINQCTVYKIKDEAHVNQRRAEVGLMPLQDYLSHWGITWAPPVGGK